MARTAQRNGAAGVGNKAFISAVDFLAELAEKEEEVRHVVARHRRCQDKVVGFGSMGNSQLPLSSVAFGS